MSWLDSIHFNDDGLVPVIAQDHATGRILMMAWANRESLTLTHQTRQAVYWSRSRGKLWHKGESSGHFQQVHEIRLDCDADVIVLIVTQIGGIACHTGRQSCFYRLLTDELDAPQWLTTDAVLKDPDSIYTNPNATPSDTADSISATSSIVSLANNHAVTMAPQDILTALDDVLQTRKTASPDSSYVASLYHKGLNKILEKIGEEATEAIIAAKDLPTLGQENVSSLQDNQKISQDTEQLVYEIADIWFHTMVTLAWFNISSSAVTDELARRFGLSGIDEKNARSNLTNHS